MSAGGIATFDLSDDGTRVLVPLSEKLFVLERSTGTVHKLTSTAGSPIDAQFSPDGKLIACVRDGDLYVTDVASGIERRLTTGATATLSHGLAEFVAQEEMDRMHGYRWSPDSRHLVYQETNTASVEELSIPDPAHPARPARTFRYPRPGKNNAVVRVGVIPVAGGKTTWIAWDNVKLPYLARVVWEKNSPLVILVQNREQTLEILYEVDPANGQTKELLRETDEAWINLNGHLPKWRRDGQSFLWATERRGTWQLESHHRDGAWPASSPRPEPQSSAPARRRRIDGRGLGSRRRDPTQTHVYRVPLDQPGDAVPPAEQLTHEPGEHSAIVAEESGVSVRSSQSLTADSKQVVYRRDGSVAGEAEEPGPQTQPAAQRRADDGRHRSDLPCGRHSSARFPGGQAVPRLCQRVCRPALANGHDWPSRYLLDGWFAEQGFIVVSLDGRGTPARGRAWERAIKNNLIEVPLADQVSGLQAPAPNIRSSICPASASSAGPSADISRRAPSRVGPTSITPAWPAHPSPTGSTMTRTTPSVTLACRRRIHSPTKSAPCWRWLTNSANRSC